MATLDRSAYVSESARLSGGSGERETEFYILKGQGDRNAPMSHLEGVPALQRLGTGDREQVHNRSTQDGIFPFEG